MQWESRVVAPSDFTSIVHRFYYALPLVSQAKLCLPSRLYRPNAEVILHHFRGACRAHSQLALCGFLALRKHPRALTRPCLARPRANQGEHMHFNRAIPDSQWQAGSLVLFFFGGFHRILTCCYGNIGFSCMFTNRHELHSKYRQKVGGFHWQCPVKNVHVQHDCKHTLDALLEVWFVVNTRCDVKTQKNATPKSFEPLFRYSRGMTASTLFAV